MRAPRRTSGAAVIQRGQGGFTLIELMVAAFAGIVVLGVAISVSLSIQRNIYATNHYSRASSDGSRVLDYVARDLRRGLRVGTMVNGAFTSIKSNVTVSINETTTLVIHIPDYYGSNVPDVDPNSPFRTSRYSRPELNRLPLFNGNGATLLNGTVYRKEAVTTVGNVETTRFSPKTLGSGEVQVRYYRAARSKTDPTLCYFRSEHQPGVETPFFAPEEITSRGEAGKEPIALVLEAPAFPATDPRYGKIFTIHSSFTPLYRRDGKTATKTAQSLTVLLRNGRRD